MKLATVESILEDMDAAEAWRPALIAFYRNDAMPQRAQCLEWGWTISDTDRRTIEALKLAFEVRP